MFVPPVRLRASSDHERGNPNSAICAMAASLKCAAAVAAASLSSSSSVLFELADDLDTCLAEVPVLVRAGLSVPPPDVFPLPWATLPEVSTADSLFFKRTKSSFLRCVHVSVVVASSKRARVSTSFIMPKIKLCLPSWIGNEDKLSSSIWPSREFNDSAVAARASILPRVELAPSADRKCFRMDSSDKMTVAARTTKIAKRTLALPAMADLALRDVELGAS
mmetsp:Transcript_51938/g.77563  ORF Transcript_51938/g.77563 Transcript_51938/m.77563 type:complete len:221 (-) Transcript_51938:2525-3187(-)